MSKAWGGLGNWAADVEREEREEAAAAAAESASSGSFQNFPSLKEAASTKPKKKKMSLNEFHTETPAASSRLFESKGLTPDEMRFLPTGPRQRSPEEMQHGRLGGGFSNYGRSGSMTGGRMRDREDTGDGVWGGGKGRQFGGFDEDRRGPSHRASDNDLPSRADEVDNWATTKKSLPLLDTGRPGRYGSLGGGGSRADEVDNWAFGKKQFAPPNRASNFGSGFRDSSLSESDRWTRGRGGFTGDADREPVRERPRLVLDPPKGNAGETEQPARTNKPNPFGSARPREEILAEKGVDWKKLDVDSKRSTSQSSRPTSSHSSRPSSAHSNKSEVLQQYGSLENVIIKPRPKVNPFGDAKPREVLLEERGQDWRKIDLQLGHRSVERPETDEERQLKREIIHLKEQLQKEPASKKSDDMSVEKSVGNELLDTISEKEKALENLIQDLDDKIRFGQRAVERPGSGAGRISGISERPSSERPGSGAGRIPGISERPPSERPGSGTGRIPGISERPPSERPSSGAGRISNFSERPPSQSGSVDESSRIEFVDRPMSRGKPDVWTRSNDEKHSFNRSRERGFVGSKDFDRPRSQGRW